MIELRAVSVDRGGRRLLTIPALAIDPADPLVILGPSGAGKTTLLRVLLGLIQPTDGEVTVFGEALAGSSPRQRAGWLAWLPQLSAPQESLPVIEYLAGARFRFDEARATTRAVLLDALRTCSVAALADRPVNRISGGELQRAQLAGLIAQEARYLVLDEPANHLDPALVAWLQALLAERILAGQGLVAVSHDLSLVTALERELGRPVRLLGLREGHPSFDLRSDDGSLTDELEALYGVPWLSLERGRARHLLPAAGSR